MQRKSSDGGYFAQSRNESTVWMGVGCGDHGRGSPYRLVARSATNRTIASAPATDSSRRRRGASQRSASPSTYPSAITPAHGTSAYAKTNTGGPEAGQTPPCKNAQIQPARPQACGATPSKRLWPSTSAAPNAAMAGIGSHTRAASTTIENPSAQSVAAKKGSKDCEFGSHPNRLMVSSATARKSPRVSRNRDSSSRDLPRASDRRAPVPASSMNTGAQKWVIHRVKKSAGVVRETSVGSNGTPLRKSRAWSMAITTMTM